MACPACQDARFHRHCIQRLALHAGIDFRCPRCLKQEPFMTEMLTMGIRLSKRPPSWQSDPDVGPSDQRHGRCDATRCLCPGGREHSQAHGLGRQQSGGEMPAGQRKRRSGRLPTNSPRSKRPVLTFMGLLCSFQTCFICCKMGATITCCQTACDRTFHLPCAPDGQCVTQYFGAYRSFCWEHRPQQALRPRPSQDNTCTICLDTVEDNISYITMACPACQDARFHRHCIQRLALHAGIDFRCPRCLKQEPFMTEMLTMGIRLSKRPPSWQSDPDVGPSDQRHGRCDATTCLCPGGREHSQAHGPWQLRLCSSCAAEGIHRLCSSLGNSTCSWECSTCAATDTGRQQSFQHYAIHTGTTMGLAPGPSAQLGSWKGRDTTAASPACSLRTVLTTFLLPAPLCRFHWQIRPCGPQNLKHRTADSVPGHGAPQEQLLHQPSAGLQACLGSSFALVAPSISIRDCAHGGRRGAAPPAPTKE
ncbi:LOW QUALITY PROTEIN: uncharacterized protein LOC128937515 [Melozone crissalis]|uniref:LOW QUALITY PROTEIN: uncharacterized protein LOC128937515 n=1 Tax=Melozone crissalis TaxID=40204 RepID=UPI0023DC159C|nr:LOW QUALITY PROTEIN: uncharacterized protein LOC128937515 [Melozone crissalis]